MATGAVPKRTYCRYLWDSSCEVPTRTKSRLKASSAPTIEGQDSAPQSPNEASDDEPDERSGSPTEQMLSTISHCGDVNHALTNGEVAEPVSNHIADRDDVDCSSDESLFNQDTTDLSETDPSDEHEEPATRSDDDLVRMFFQHCIGCSTKRITNVKKIDV